jgi:hypothetical protein
MPDEDKVSFAKLIQSLSSDRIYKLIEETRALYRHTQKCLADVGLKQVTLGRRLYLQSATVNGRGDYGHTFVALWQSAKTLGLKEISIEMDSLNAFGDDGAYLHYPIAMRLEVPTADVLYCTNLVVNRESPEGSFHMRGAGESGEWQIINRSPTGVVKLPVECIHVDEDKLIPWNRYKNRDHAEYFLEKHMPAYIDPTKGRVAENRYTGKAYAHTPWGRIAGAWSMLRGHYQ